MLRNLEIAVAQPTTKKEIWDWAHSLPKIDLHRHLEGSLRLDTLAEIALEHGIDLPSYDIEQLRPYVQVTDDPPDFHRFLEKFRLLRRFYTSKEAVQRVTREAICDAANDNIRYLELRFNPVALSRIQNFALQDVVEWVIEAAEKAQEETGTRTCLILQIGREENINIANEIVDLAINYLGPMVRGIDLAGDEIHYPAHLFAEPFSRASKAGVKITVHAGEAVGPDSVRSAIEFLKAERIGHGIRSIENSEVVQMVYERKVALEVCPTSNLQTGAVKGLSLHPLADLFRLRLRTTINTDDPSVSDTTLTDEYVVAVTAIGLPKVHIYQALSNALHAAFIPEAEFPHLKQQFRELLASYTGAQEIIDRVP
ncbi:MAG: adenosine deaminase [Anaerolineae bacterium]|nr:adenosine deaminase [Anaerolineae bacterium]